MSQIFGDSLEKRFSHCRKHYIVQSPSIGRWTKFHKWKLSNQGWVNFNGGPQIKTPHGFSQTLNSCSSNDKAFSSPQNCFSTGLCAQVNIRWQRNFIPTNSEICQQCFEYLKSSNPEILKVEKEDRVTLAFLCSKPAQRIHVLLGRKFEMWNIHMYILYVNSLHWKYSWKLNSGRFLLDPIPLIG